MTEIEEITKKFEDKLVELQTAFETASKDTSKVEEVKKVQEEIKKTQAELKDKLEKLDTAEKKGLLGSGVVDEKKEYKEGMLKAGKFFKAYKERNMAEVKALSEGVDSEGGYLVPIVFSNKVFEIARTYGLVRRLATIVPMTAKELKFPKLDDSALSFDYISEKGKKPGKTVTFGQIPLKALKTGGIIPVTEELLADSNVNVMALLARVIARAMAKFEDTEAFSGVGGADAFEGLFTNALVANVTFAAGKEAFSDLKTEYLKLSDMIDAIDPAFLGNARYVTNSKVLGYLRSAKDGDGRLIWGPANGKTPETIWNYPVERSRVLPGPTDSAADKKFIAFGDFKSLYLGQRQGLAVKILDQATITDSDGSTILNLAEQDMIGIRAVERLCIKIAETEAFATLKTAAGGS